ncbi:CDP-archaeol synthase [Ectothiorhodospiraceae bacterium WFHF3C12]|nr:CDP-archaeol synthase [Ectothiorhodospiraceae bacterium WFHF3C12]
MLANGAPIVAARLAGRRWAWPVDAGLHWADGRRLLGPSKTWRGLAVGVAAAAVAGAGLGLPLWTGAVIGGLSLVGDLFSSFIKRRIGVPASGRATGLDQIPEALVPTALLAPALGLNWTEAVAVVAAFVVVELALSWAGYRIGLRQRPY